MLDAFKEKFYPKGINWQMELEFVALKQLPGQTVQQYASQVEKIGSKLAKSDITVMQTFVRGLLPAYKRAVLSRGPTTFQEAQQVASLLQNAEIVTSNDPKVDGTHLVLKELMDKIEGLATSSPRHQQKKNNRPANSAQSSGPSVSHKQQTIICNYCHKTGHVIKNCRLRLSQNRRSHQATSCRPSFVDVKQIQCYRCSQHGHYSST